MWLLPQDRCRPRRSLLLASGQKMSHRQPFLGDKNTRCHLKGAIVAFSETSEQQMTIKPTRSILIASPNLSLEDFKADEPSPRAKFNAGWVHGTDMIDGVSVTALASHSDSRGSLSELLTTRDGPIEPIVHVYQVTAEAGSRRAWFYHRFQHDRLAFANGRFRIVLYDIRPQSPTFNMLNVFFLGRNQSGLVRIPPFVVHAVQNIGREAAIFVNLPTKAWDASAPDKCRLPENDPRIPFNLDE